MITLGINAAFHDSAAAIVVDGITIAAAEEERFSRIKHGKRPVPFSAWELPFNAIDFCLAQAGVTLADVDHIAYSFDPREFLGDRASLDEAMNTSITLPLHPSHKPGDEWENPWDPLFAAFIVNAPGQLADGAPHHLQQRFKGVSEEQLRQRWHFVNHHTCHQASAFLAAPFSRCAVMTLDGRGEHASTTYGIYRDDTYQSLGEVVMPHSLGMLYERVTDHLGFLHSSDEYKVMALAALGKPIHREALLQHVRVGQDGSYSIGDVDLEALVGPKRQRGGELTQAHFDLTASLQVVLEETVLQLASWLREASGERHLAMAGGVALNCVMNAKLRDQGPFESVWVQPAAGDAGTALGAALWIDSRERAAATSADASFGITRLAPKRWQMDHAYLGPAYDDDAIERALSWAKLPYRKLDDTEDIAATTAQLLADDKMIGWYQGRMEFGPRALGSRSILASPIDPDMQARLNELKDREDFRPVAPAVLAEAAGDWFEPADANGGRSPFMLFVYGVKAGQGERIPSACHTDKTARVQTVHADSNPRFHALLKAFEQLTGVPVLVNTSFNVRGEPIVCTPRDAIEAFYSTPLDALVIGSFLVEKRPEERT
jgi:carbamoyltransferase